MNVSDKQQTKTNLYQTLSESVKLSVPKCPTKYAFLDLVN